VAEPLRVLITDHPWLDLTIERSVLEPLGVEVVEPAEPGAGGIAALAPTADAVGVCWAPFPGELLERCPRCRVVARFGVGLDNIPLATASRLGVPVTYVPDYCVSEVADHTLSLILALLRGLPAFDGEIKGGGYEPNLFVPRRLATLTLGVVGFGRIGRAVADRARAFGMTVIAASRSGDGHGRAVKMVSLDELLAAADVVSLHVPLTAETHRLLNRERLARLRRGVYIVNTSRGPLIDSAALLVALNDGRLAGAGLDVFDPEPPAADDPLVRHPRVIATPHVAFRSAEGVTELRTRAARQIADVLTGRVPEHVVNPEVFRTA
jgi:D-3-phosphoglycerate dehydrogenase / 2-oxoglutarate reductase